MNSIGMLLLGDAGIGGINWSLVPWYVLASVALVTTALFSGIETGIYGLSKMRLRVRMHKREPAALKLAGWIEHPTYVLEGLLLWQNLATFIFSAATATIFAGYGVGEFGQAVISTLVITPLVLIFAEIIPKDLFYTHTDRWTYRCVALVRHAFRVITVVPLLPIVQALGQASLFVIHRGKIVPEVLGPRQEMMILIQEPTATGVLSGTQQDLIQRALRMARIIIRDVMMPWSRVVGVPATITSEGFRALVRRYGVSRVPVLGKSTNEVLGVVEVLAVLGDTGDFNLARHLRPVMTLIGEQDVRSAITLMQRARQTLAVVVDRQGRAVGLVTMKDLIEELVGDISDW
jgi:putative hemolysin